MSDEIMTVEELAKYLKTGVTTIYNLAQKGKIPATKVGNQWRFRKEKINEWLDQGGKASFKGKSKGTL
jgi:excisionase family DNA binding protein